MRSAMSDDRRARTLEPAGLQRRFVVLTARRLRRRRTKPAAARCPRKLRREAAARVAARIAAAAARTGTARSGSEAAAVRARSEAATRPEPPPSGSRLARTRGTRRADARPTGARRLRLRDEHELPLVVMVPPVVEANRLVSALARDADDTGDHAARLVREGPLPCRRRECRRLLLTTSSWRLPTSSRRLSTSSRRLPAATRRLPRARGTADAARRLPQRHEVLAGDRVLVFLAQELLLDEHVDARRQRPRSRPALEETDRPRVLLTPEDQLRLFFPLSHRLPHGKGDAQHHAHHAQRYEQDGHGIARFRAPLGPGDRIRRAAGCTGWRRAARRRAHTSRAAMRRNRRG